MRLINCQTLEFEEFYQVENLSYAILSHRWQDDEISYQEMLGDQSQLWNKQGYQKISSFCKKALEQQMTYAWIDTCCIDKTSSAELSEAINSMYHWYSQSTICYVYLYDYKIDHQRVDRRGDVIRDSLSKSLWFHRGWTLQELIAPQAVFFYDTDWQFIGSKSELCPVLSSITRVPEDVLTGEVDVRTLTIAERMSWAGKRECSRVEDVAYSLMGLFDVNMLVLYGEGPKAFKRLQEEIIKQDDDQTIFLWQATAEPNSTMLASHPIAFETSWRYRRRQDNLSEYRITNSGLQMNVLMQPWLMDTYIGLLDCEVSTDSEDETWRHPALFLMRIQQTSRWVRLIIQGHSFALLGIEASQKYCQRKMSINIALHYVCSQKRAPDPLGIRIRSLKLCANAENSIDGNSAFILSQSNVYSKTKWDPEQCFLKLPPGAAGVVAVICFPAHLGGPIAAIKLGLDFDFVPVCVVSTMDCHRREISAVRIFPGHGLDDMVDDNMRHVPRDFTAVNCMETEGWDESSSPWKEYCYNELLTLKPPAVNDRVTTSRWRGASVRRSTHILCDLAQNQWELEIVFAEDVVDDNSSISTGHELDPGVRWNLFLECTYLPDSKCQHLDESMTREDD